MCQAPRHGHWPHFAREKKASDEQPREGAPFRVSSFPDRSSDSLDDTLERNRVPVALLVRDDESCGLSPKPLAQRLDE